MARISGAMRSVGPGAARAAKQRQEQSKAAIAGSKAAQAAAATTKTAPKSTLPGVLGRMADIAARRRKK